MTKAVFEPSSYCTKTNMYRTNECNGYPNPCSSPNPKKPLICQSSFGPNTNPGSMLSLSMHIELE